MEEVELLCRQSLLSSPPGVEDKESPENQKMGTYL